MTRRTHPNLLRAAALLASISAQHTLHADSQPIERMYGWGFPHFEYCVDPLNDGGIASAAFSDNHTLLLLKDGTVRAYGCSSGPGEAACNVPSDLAGVIAVEAGLAHSIAILADGSVRCWGDNSWGQTAVPAGLTDVVQVAACEKFSFARRTNGSVVGWGRPDFGQDVIPENLIAHDIDVSDYLAVAVNSSNMIQAWGGGAKMIGSAPSTAVGVAAGDLFISILLSNGQVVHRGEVPSSWSSTVVADAIDVAAGINFSVALRADGSVARWGDVSELEVPTTIGPAGALYAGGSQIAVKSTRTACDGCVAEAAIDCNANGVADAMDIARGASRDANGTGVPDECEFHTVCASSGQLPVDLLLVADNSSSMVDLQEFCSEILTPVAEALRVDFDLEVHWFDIVAQLRPEFDCPVLDGLHVIPDLTPVPSCGGVDREVESREDWGDAATIVSNPVSGIQGWSPREQVVTIVVALSDEGAEGGSDNSPCDDQDYLAALNAAVRGLEWGVVHVPVAFPDSTECVYSHDGTGPRLMNMLAERTGGSVVDARALGDRNERPAITAAMLQKIRNAIEASPRIHCSRPACPADLDRNGEVDATDLSLVLAGWNEPGGDADGDGTTTASDLSLVLAGWGACAQ